MSENDSSSAAKPKRSFLSGLAWWREDPVEIQRQVTEYKSLKLWQSARGISLLFCAFSVVVTVLLRNAIGLSVGTVIFEVVIWGSLGLLMLRGQKWAFMAGVVLWTLEKGVALVDGFSSGGAPIVQVIWWAAYLNAFMLGFRVEKARRAAPVDSANV